MAYFDDLTLEVSMPRSSVGAQAGMPHVASSCNQASSLRVRAQALIQCVSRPGVTIQPALIGGPAASEGIGHARVVTTMLLHASAQKPSGELALGNAEQRGLDCIVCHWRDSNALEDRRVNKAKWPHYFQRRVYDFSVGKK